MQKNASWNTYMDKPFDLLKYITDDFNDKTHPSLSLIDIFLDDPRYYESLISERSIDPRAACFIEIYASDIEKTKGRHPLFRYLVCNQLVTKFLKVHSINHINWKNYVYYRQRRAKQNPEKASEGTDDSSNDNSLPEHTDNQNNLLSEAQEKFEKVVLHCPKDLSPMKARDIRIVNDNGYTTIIPEFACPDCGQLYTWLSTYDDFQTVTISKEKGKTKYININNRKTSYAFRPSFEISPYEVEGNTKTNYLPRNCYMYRTNHPSVCTFDGTSLRSGWFINPRGEKLPLTACPLCGTVYVSERFYNKYKDVLNCIGQEPKRKIPEKPKPQPEPKKSQKPKKPQKEIQIKDFIVKRSTLNCSHKKHKIELIDALVNFRDRNGEIRQRIIPAGYCPQCKAYFIMENTFDNLKRYGIPLCRIVDEKMYKQIRSGHRLDLASQSILMQYGYNASKKDDLSSIQRRGILEMLMDEGICTKHEIISLLNYFIHMREGQNTNMYDLAISKWEADRDYVEAYGVGKNRKVGIGTIRRK